MTSATEVLRRMLDERGVEWWQSVNMLGCVFTRWYSPLFSDEVVAMENGDGELELFSHLMTPEQAIASTLGPKVTGDTSDGYHTFNELYHHRAVLFSVIVRDHRELAWKSMRHHDGTMYDGMFIVGIETPEGQATYHYDIDPYWDMFNCKELDQAPEWDGHTPSEAIERIATLVTGTCHPTDYTAPCVGEDSDVCVGDYHEFWEPACKCSVCGSLIPLRNYCPNCGAKVVGSTTNDVDTEVEQ